MLVIRLLIFIALYVSSCIISSLFIPNFIFDYFAQFLFHFTWYLVRLHHWLRVCCFLRISWRNGQAIVLIVFTVRIDHIIGLFTLIFLYIRFLFTFFTRKFSLWVRGVDIRRYIFTLVLWLQKKFIIIIADVDHIAITFIITFLEAICLFRITVRGSFNLFTSLRLTVWISAVCQVDSNLAYNL